MRESGFIRAHQIDYHRNGVGGIGFYAVLFTMRDDNGDVRNMVATVIPLQDGESWNGQVTVLDVDLAAQGIIKFGHNSWRGDVYEAELREAIAAWTKVEDERKEREYRKNLMENKKRTTGDIKKLRERTKANSQK